MRMRIHSIILYPARTSFNTNTDSESKREKKKVTSNNPAIHGKTKCDGLRLGKPSGVGRLRLHII